MRLSHKIFAFSFVIATVTLAGVAVHTVNETTALMTSQSVDAATRHAEREADIFYDQVESAVSDVLLLASLDAAQKISRAITERERHSHRSELQRVFFTLMEEKDHYVQVRLIAADRQGRELVRVNRTTDGISAVAEPALQAKAHRYYHQQAVKLGQGQTFVSKVDLNREHGEIVTPHQPTLRVAAPVLDTHGVLFGVVVINLDVNTLLTKAVSVLSEGFPVLINCAGEYLYHPDADRMFAFEFGRQDRIQDEFRIHQSWQTWIQDPGGENSRVFASPSHIVSMARVDLPHAWDEEDGIRTLAIGNVIPQTRILQAGDALRDHLYVTLLAICVFLGVAIAGATHVLTRPVTALTRAADRIAAGEGRVDVPITTTDEIGTLGRALRRMLRALEEVSRTKELAALGRMAAMIAHDLRNAMSSVKVNIQALEKGCRHPAPQRERQWGLVRDQIRYMEEVLSEMLVFARPEKLNHDWQDPRSLLEAATISLMREAREKEVTVNLIGLGVLPSVWGDRTQLIRVFRNLTENALQAVAPGGNIHFEGSVAMADTGTEVLIKVIDDGEGIPAAARDHLFTPFFTTRSAGTGLGLAIVKRIVDQHGGRIDFHSGHGRGSTFLVVLPTQPVPPDMGFDP